MILNGDYTIQDLTLILRENSEEYFAQLKSPIMGVESLIAYLDSAMFNSNQESFGVVYLDNRHHPTKLEVLFKGTVDQSVVYTREIIKGIVLNGASAIIITHNHPGGSNKPSVDDDKITKEIQAAVKTIDVRLLDHIIIGRPGDHYSYKEHGKL